MSHHMLFRSIAVLVAFALVPDLALAARSPLDNFGPSGPLARVERFIQNGNLAEAEQELNRLIAGRECAAREQALLGRVFALREELAAALEHYRAAQTCGLRDRAFLLELATAYSIAGNHEQAVRTYQGFLEQNPKDAEFLNELGLTELARGNTAQAVQILARAKQAAPENLQVATDYGMALLYHGSIAEAKTVLSQVTARDATFQPAFVALGDTLVMQKSDDQAFLAFEAAIKLVPRDTRARLKRAALALHTRREEVALKDFLAILSYEPGNARALVGEVRCYLALNQLKQAAERLAQAEQGGPIDQPSLLLLRGELQRRRGEFAPAEKTLVQVVATVPDSVKAWQELQLIAIETKNAALQKQAAENLSRLQAAAAPGK